jgi:VIT1/CCC1 family predicted Fe2+/Mn2+ transporter
MDELTQTLIKLSISIRDYKLMQAICYNRLVNKTESERLQQMLLAMSSREEEDARDWTAAIQGLSQQGAKPVNTRMLRLRVALMMSLLGTRGFMEWAIIAEDESIEALAVLAGNLEDQEASETWTRIANDERLHIEHTKKEILGMEGWEMGGGGGVRDVIFGANDGLVSILALVAGVFGAVEQSNFVLLTGVAGAIAGTVSMGAGAYVSSKSEQEVTQKEQQRKGIRKKRSPQKEMEELVSFYQVQGFARSTAIGIAQRVSERVEQTEALTLGEELGLTSDEEWPPLKAGLLTGLSFMIASLVPILPFALLDITPAAITAGIASLVFLFLIGASKAIFTRQNWIRSGLEVFGIGTLAALITYMIGLVFPE